MSAAFIDFQDLKSRVGVAGILAPLELKLARKGDQFRGPCPTCKSGGDRALVVTVSKGAFYCFGAKQGGDVIGLAAHILGQDMKHAANWIAEQTGKRADKPAAAAQSRPEPVKGLTPLAYLDPLHSDVIATGIDSETAKEWGIGYAPKGTIRGRVLFPVRDRAGTLLAYGGLGENPRWLFPSNFDPFTAIFAADKAEKGRSGSSPIRLMQCWPIRTACRRFAF